MYRIINKNERMIELIKAILNLICTESFWYISTLNLCVVGIMYILVSPFFKVKKKKKWDDLDI